MLKVGQSILFDNVADVECARHALRGIGKCKTRKVDGGWRLWRVE